jgi:hypothetical protein
MTHERLLCRAHPTEPPDKDECSLLTAHCYKQFGAGLLSMEAFSGQLKFVALGNMPFHSGPIKQSRYQVSVRSGVSRDITISSKGLTRVSLSSRDLKSL